MRVLDLFSGIGGFSLGLEQAGMETVAFCEIDPYCQRVLGKRWPGVPVYGDVTELTNEKLKSDGVTGIEVITAGFPCQDISAAGSQKGINAERSGLWSECARLVSEIRPKYAIFENVTALTSGDNGRWFARVLGDLASVGFDAEWHCIPAYIAGSPQSRDRVWIIAHPQSDSVEAKKMVGQEIYDRQIQVQSGRVGRDVWSSWDADKCPMAGVADGIPNWVDRCRALGNAVVPQIPELIGRAIMRLQA